MKKYILLNLLLISLNLYADGISFQSVTLDFYQSNLHRAVRVKVRDFDETQSSFTGSVEENSSGYPASGINQTLRFQPEEYPFNPGEWVLVFHYWHSLEFYEIEEETTVIAIPTGTEGEYIFIEDTPWNWRKVKLFISEYQMRNWLKEQEKDNLQPYLSDPDMSFPVYQYLKESNRITEARIIDALWNYPVPIIDFWSGLSLFHYYMQDLSPQQQSLFLMDMGNVLNEDFHYDIAFFLSQYYYQDLKLYEEQNLLLIDAVFQEESPVNHREDFFYPLLSYQTQGVSLERILPLLGKWASLEGDEDWEYIQLYCLNTFYQQLKWDEKTSMIHYLGSLSKNRRFIENHTVLLNFIQNAIDNLPEEKRRLITEELEETNPVLYKKIQKD